MKVCQVITLFLLLGFQVITLFNFMRIYDLIGILANDIIILNQIKVDKDLRGN